MSSAAQIAANQANARLSTGPATAAGKAASARNALRHGFRSQTVLLSSDDPAEYQALLDRLHAEFLPTDLTAERCLREMADAEWRLRRSRTHQEFMIAAKVKDVFAANPNLSPIECEIEAQTQLLTQSAYFRELRAWEAKFERQYDRAAKARTNHKRSAYSLAIQQAVLAPLPIRAPPRNRTNEANPPARSAPCPCGSREKYKRCCGKFAPPLLNAA
jgi:hypothetical protein